MCVVRASIELQCTVQQAGLVSVFCLTVCVYVFGWSVYLVVLHHDVFISIRLYVCVCISVSLCVELCFLLDCVCLYKCIQGLTAETLLTAGNINIVMYR